MSPPKLGPLVPLEVRFCYCFSSPDYRKVLSCSSIVLSLFSIVVSLSSISLSILPSSSSRGPMYCPGLSGEGRGSMGRGRSGSGRFGRSKGVA